MEHLTLAMLLYSVLPISLFWATQLTGTASDFLGRATFDSSYQDEREQISDNCQTSSDHLTAGLIGLSSGVFGGITSIFTQPYYSAKSDGIGVSGGRGLCVRLRVCGCG